MTNERQQQTPYLDALCEYARRHPARLHVPGHKGGPGADPGLLEAFGEQAVSLDIPALTYGIDLGVEPTPFEQAQRLAAEAWGARRAWFLVNGASQGNLAAGLALAHYGRDVVVQRNAHSSTIDALVLSGMRPTFAAPEVDPELGIAHCLTPEMLELALAQTPEAVDAWVVSQAVKLAAQGEPVDVNLSAASIGNPEILDHIERELARRKVDPAKLVFETTEAALIKNAERGEPFATRLTELGCSLAIDDFGPVNGSLTNLERYFPDYLKIDIEFVRHVATSTAAQQVVKDIVALAADVGQQTIAEGVEDEETLITLDALGVDFAQGFHVVRPAPNVNLLAARPL